MRFKITGAHKLTAADEVITVEAEGTEEAIKLANERGLLVSNVEAIEPRPGADCEWTINEYRIALIGTEVTITGPSERLCQLIGERFSNLILADEGRFVLFDADCKQLQLIDALANCRDVLGSHAAKIAIVGQHTTQLRGILLIEKQLELFFAAVHIRNTQLAGQLLALRRDEFFGGRLLALEVGKLAFACLALSTNFRALLAGILNAGFGDLKFAYQRITSRRVSLNGLSDCLNALADLL